LNVSRHTHAGHIVDKLANAGAHVAGVVRAGVRVITDLRADIPETLEPRKRITIWSRGTEHGVTRSGLAAVNAAKISTSGADATFIRVGVIAGTYVHAVVSA